jgi:predicted nucleotide-binding protein
MNVSKKLYVVLKNIKENRNEIDNEIFPSVEDYGAIVESLTERKFIEGANIVRAGQGNKIQFINVENARITVDGTNFIDNYIEYTDEERHQLVLEIIKKHTGTRKIVTASLIRRLLPEKLEIQKIEWILNNLVEQKKIRKIKGESFKGFDGKTQKGDTYYEIIPELLKRKEGGLMNITNNKIFIIHGHDELMKSSVQLLLTRAGLNDIVLHEQPDRGRTIIDKLIEETNDACYAIALLSPDDLGENGKRARQNVILEVGYFLGKLGKERVRLLVKENVEIPSDLQGIIYEPFDASGNWRMRLLKEIQAAGIEVGLEEVMKKL